jgi:hypothetical protein
MSQWCQSHPTYSAKKEPNSLCGKCWSLWFYRCPEEQGKQSMLDHIAWREKNLVSEASKPPRKG